MESADSGSQTATLDTEHTLATETTAGTYILTVDMGNLVSGDIVVLKIKTKVRSGDTSRIVYTAVFSGVQAEPNKYSIPVPVIEEIVCTLEQTDGTGRAFPWNLLLV